MSWLGKLFWALLAILTFVFAALAVNQETIALQLVTWRTPELSVFWWLLLAFVSGLAVGMVGIAWSTTRLSLKNRGLNKRLSKAEKELDKLQQAELSD